MGAKITGAGTESIVIEGVEKLHGVEHAVIPDRIEAGTYALAAAATRGDVAIRRCVPEHLAALTIRMAATGARIEASGDTLRVRAEGPLVSHDVATAPYPGFPTDLQAQWMALAAGMDGVATITERAWIPNGPSGPTACTVPSSAISSTATPFSIRDDFASCATSAPLPFGHVTTVCDASPGPRWRAAK